jgi:hypothetical protein
MVFRRIAGVLIAAEGTAIANIVAAWIAAASRVLRYNLEPCGSLREVWAGDTSGLATCERFGQVASTCGVTEWGVSNGCFFGTGGGRAVL